LKQYKPRFNEEAG